MGNMIEKLNRTLKSAFSGIYHHLAMSISCIGAVSVTLFLISFALIVAFNVENFTTVIENDLKIRISVDTLAPEYQFQSIEHQIKQIDGVKSVTFSSKDEELAILILENPDVFSRYKKDNPLSDAYIIEVENANQLDSVSKQLANINEIEKVEYGGNSVSQMIKAFMDLRQGCYALAIALGLITLFLIVNMIKMSVSTRKDEVSIMRFVGASNLYIKIPFVLEGMIIGFLGAILPIILTVLLYTSFYNSFDGQMVSSMLVLKNPNPLMWELAILLVVAGTLVGMIGSFYAISRYLRWKR